MSPSPNHQHIHNWNNSKTKCHSIEYWKILEDIGRLDVEFLHIYQCKFYFKLKIRFLYDCWLFYPNPPCPPACSRAAPQIATPYLSRPLLKWPVQKPWSQSGKPHHNWGVIGTSAAGRRRRKTVRRWGWGRVECCDRRSTCRPPATLWSQSRQSQCSATTMTTATKTILSFVPPSVMFHSPSDLGHHTNPVPLSSATLVSSSIKYLLGTPHFFM